MALFAGMLGTLASIPRALSAQSPSCSAGPSSGSPIVVGRRQAALPVDRIADLLALEPGVASLDHGDLSVRAAGTNRLAIYLDGVPVTPGFRNGSTALLGGSYYGEHGSGLALGTNGFQSVILSPGATAGEFGNAVGGVAQVKGGPACDSLPAARSFQVRGGWATDALFGTSNGLNFNRLTLDGGAGVGGFRFGAALVLEGQGTDRLGLEQNASPVYLAAGVDTSVTVVNATDTSVVDVLRFRPSEGNRIPVSATSSYALLAQGAYQLGAGHRLSLTFGASQDQAREFDYLSLYNPQNLQADRQWSRVITGSWFGPLLHHGGLRLEGEAHLSWQTDRGTRGPLTSTGEQGSRDPFGGFLLAPFDFRFDAGNFAVNDQLVRNFRLNTGRRSPYDLSDVSPYQLVARYRTNPYGMRGFYESGGPVGPLTLAREDRLVAKAAADAWFGEQHRVRAGFENVRYDVDYYSSRLVSQQLAEAFVEAPTRAALFADYELAVPGLRVDAGLRYDRFRSGASRPDFPRISSAPGFDPARPTAGFRTDQAHARLSPRAGFEARATDRLTFYGSVAALAQVPDFSQVFAGINTDLSTTLSSQVYGTDLNFERSTIGEIGARGDLGWETSVSGSVWTRSDRDLVALRFRGQFDPLRGSPVDLSRYLNVAKAGATGVDLRVTRRLGWGSAWLSYSYVDPDQEARGTTRAHTAAAAVLYQVPRSAELLGGILGGTGVYADARVATGTGYTRCPASVPQDVSVLSGEVCSRNFVGEINGSTLPALKLVDLRLTRDIPVGGSTLVVFADARNLLNTRNVTRVFAQTGKVSNARERAAVLLREEQAFAADASRNGALRVDGSMDLTFGGAADPRAACGAWVNSTGAGATPDCLYLLEAEQRFGNGDHVFTTAEEDRAVNAYYEVGRGLQNFTGPGRRVRLGVELRF